MSKQRLENQSRNGQRIGIVEDCGISILKYHRIKFNKLSVRDGSGKTNIVSSEEDIIGVLFVLTETQIALLTSIEVGYRPLSVDIEWNNLAIKAITYIAMPTSIEENILPTREYLTFLIEGAREHNFPELYISMLETQSYQE